jgi:hypothetical protein
MEIQKHGGKHIRKNVKRERDFENFYEKLASVESIQSVLLENWAHWRELIGTECSLDQVRKLVLFYFLFRSVLFSSF